MVRVKCSVSYDGSKFHGFQVQNKLRTVQGEIQKALKNICKEEIIIHGSGRTDAKVHGTKQVFHFDTTREMPEAQWKRAINHFLPNDIYILDSYFVDENFHSRYSAIKKEYHYLLSTNEYSPFETNYIFQYGRPLDLELMREAAKIFIGEHDFASFCGNPKMKKSTVREIYSIDVSLKGSFLNLTYHGSGFLQYMVRILSGTLLEVGQGKRTPESMYELLEERNRSLAGATAPAKGLCLLKVDYSKEA